MSPTPQPEVVRGRWRAGRGRSGGLQARERGAGAALRALSAGTRVLSGREPKIRDQALASRSQSGARGWAGSRSPSPPPHRSVFGGFSPSRASPSLCRPFPHSFFPEGADGGPDAAAAGLPWCPTAQTVWAPPSPSLPRGMAQVSAGAHERILVQPRASGRRSRTSLPQIQGPLEITLNYLS